MLDLPELASRLPPAPLPPGDGGLESGPAGIRYRQMDGPAAVEPLLQRLVRRYSPVSVWLFGSRARGDARTDSDWDIMVVVPDDAPDLDLDLCEAWQVRRGTGISADIVPIRHREFIEDFGIPGALPYEVAMDGMLLHER